MADKIGRIPVRVLVASALVLWGLLSLLGCQSPSATPSPAATAVPPAAPQQAAAPTAAPQQAPTAAPQQAPTAVPQQPAQVAPTEVLKLGILANLTGPGSQVVINTERLIRMGMDDINAAGGVKVGGKSYRMEAVTVDATGGTSEAGVQAANRLVLAEKVPIIMGAASSPTAGAQSITEANKVMLFSISVLDRGLGPKFPLSFMGITHTQMRVRAIYAQLVKDYPQAKRVALVYSDDATGRGMADNADAVSKEKGLTIVAKEFYPVDLKDFTGLITRVMRQNPDAIDFGPGSRGQLFVASMKGLKEQGFKGVSFANGATLTDIRDAGATADNFFFPMVADHKSPVLSDAFRRIAQRLIDKHGATEFEAGVVQMYDVPLILKQAMEKAGTVSDIPKLAQNMRDGTWDTVYGKSRFLGAKTFGLAAVVEQPVYLSKAQDGKVTTFAAVNVDLP